MVDRQPPRRRAAALRHEPGRGDAPSVVARGEGHVADRILEIARQHDIPVHHDAGLVDVLSRLDLEREIPTELYQVVAELLVFIYRMQALAATRAAPSDH